MGAAASTRRSLRSTSLGALPSSSSPSPPSSKSTCLLASPATFPLPKKTHNNDTFTLYGIDLSSLNAETASQILKKVQDLEKANQEYKMELSLIYALDNIRDDASDPASMN